MTTIELNKQVVREFHHLVVNERNPKEAVARCFGMNYTQHNPIAPDGVEAFVRVMTAALAAQPDLRVDVKRMVAEGDLVAMHSHFIPAPGQRGRAVIDFFRLEDGKIVEHWDVSQDVPEASANTNTMF